RSWDATDACGNHSATVSQTFTIIDNVSPTIGGRGANGMINCTGTVNFLEPTASDACNGATVNNLGDVTGGSGCSKTITRSWDATDRKSDEKGKIVQTFTSIDNVTQNIGAEGANGTINGTGTTNLV